MSVKTLAWLAVAACLVAHTVAHAQKGKGPKPEPVDIPGEAWLLPGDGGRWVPDPDPDPDGVDFVDWDLPDNPCANAAAPPGIYGDGAGDRIDDNPSYVAFLRASDSDFKIDLSPVDGRLLYMYFNEVHLAPTSSQPLKEFCALALEQFHLNTHVLKADGTDDINLGLLDIPPTQTHPARINSSFVVNGITYQLRFNASGSSGSAGSTNVKITRGPRFDLQLPNEQWWLIETGFGAPESGEIASLTTPAQTKKGNPGPNDEGRYRLPFKIYFTTDLNAP